MKWLAGLLIAALLVIVFTVHIWFPYLVNLIINSKWWR